MDTELVDPILEPDHEKSSGNSLSEIPRKIHETLSGGDCESHFDAALKHNMPVVLGYPMKYTHLEGISVVDTALINRLTAPNKIPDRSILFPNPDCFFLQQKAEPPLCIPLDDEGDKTVSKILKNAIDEHLSFEIGELAIREKYKWIERWATLRYKQSGKSPSLSRNDAQSLDEILNYDSDHELLPTSRITADLPSLTNEVCLPDIFHVNPPTPSSSNAPKENAQGNELQLVRPRINFYNALPEDFNSEVSGQYDLTQSTLTQVTEAVKTSENDLSSSSLAEDGNVAIEDDVATVDTSFTNTSSTNVTSKDTRQTSPVSIATSELQSIVHWSPRSEENMKSCYQNPGEIHLSSHKYCERRSTNQSVRSNGSGAYQVRTTHPYSSSSKDRNWYSHKFHSLQTSEQKSEPTLQSRSLKTSISGHFSRSSAEHGNAAIEGIEDYRRLSTRKYYNHRYSDQSGSRDSDHWTKPSTHAYYKPRSSGSSVCSRNYNVHNRWCEPTGQLRELKSSKNGFSSRSSAEHVNAAIESDLANCRCLSTHKYYKRRYSDQSGCIDGDHWTKPSTHEYYKPRSSSSSACSRNYNVHDSWCEPTRQLRALKSSRNGLSTRSSAEHGNAAIEEDLANCHCLSTHKYYKRRYSDQSGCIDGEHWTKPSTNEYYKPRSSSSSVCSRNYNVHDRLTTHMSSKDRSWYSQLHSSSSNHC